ncbi:hypothetical protein BSKO_11809 [Bryopsis sp. KO-2023]|nr:hypothetical protein BSKO_11809 [Bryopsis sp. KO-2023]
MCVRLCLCWVCLENTAVHGCDSRQQGNGENGSENHCCLTLKQVCSGIRSNGQRERVQRGCMVQYLASCRISGGTIGREKRKRRSTSGDVLSLEGSLVRSHDFWWTELTAPRSSRLDYCFVVLKGRVAFVSMDGSYGTNPSKSRHLSRVEVDGYVWKPSEGFSKSARCPGWSCGRSRHDEMPSVTHNVDWRKYTVPSGTPWGQMEFMEATWEEDVLRDVMKTDAKMPRSYSRHRVQSTGSDLDNRGAPLRNLRFSSDVLPKSTDFRSTVVDISRSNKQSDTVRKGVHPTYRKAPARKKKHKLAVRLLQWFSCGRLPAEPEVKTFMRDAAGDISGSRVGGKGMRGSSNLYRARHQAFMQRVKDSMSGDEDFRTSIPSPSFFEYPAFGLSQETLFIVDEGTNRKADLDSAKIEDAKKVAAKRKLTLSR